MSVDFEEQLRSEMAAVEVRPRPGLVRAAYRGCQRRRRMTRVAAAAGTAAVTAGGTAAGLAATAGNGTGAVPAQTTAYVVSHMTKALAVTGLISYSHTTILDANPAHPGFQQSSWAYGAWGREWQTRYLTSTLGGQPSSDEQEVYTWGPAGEPAENHMTQVDYPARTATRSVWTFPGATAQQKHALGCNAFIPAGGVTAVTGGALSSSAANNISTCLRYLLAHHQLTVAGHQRVHGIDTIKILLRPAGWQVTLWISPSSYLPVQSLDVPRPAGNVQLSLGLATGTLLQVTTDYRWLPATPANLAQLTAPIPAGFTVSG